MTKLQTEKKTTAKKSAPAKTNVAPFVKVTQLRSFFGILPKQQACLIGLGLRKINSSSVLRDTPSVRGMINKVNHLIKIEEVQS